MLRVSTVIVLNKQYPDNLPSLYLSVGIARELIGTSSEWVVLLL